MELGTVPEPTSLSALSTVGSKSWVKPGHPHLFHVNQSSCTLQPRHPRHDRQRLLPRNAMGAAEHLLIRSTQLQFLGGLAAFWGWRSSMDGFIDKKHQETPIRLPTRGTPHS